MANYERSSLMKVFLALLVMFVVSLIVGFYLDLKVLLLLLIFYVLVLFFLLIVLYLGVQHNIDSKHFKNMKISEELRSDIGVELLKQKHDQKILYSKFAALLEKNSKKRR